MAGRPRSPLPALAGAVVLSALFWNSRALWPLRELTVFFHEISHALAALATGGSVTRIALESREGGLTYTKGGNWFLVDNAGYLGSLVWGCGLILLSSWTRRGRLIVGTLGAFLAVVTVACVRGRFGLGFGLAAAAALMLAAWKLSDETDDFLVKLIGTVSALYVVPDVWSDVVRGSGVSDATMLAQRTHVPALVWGLGWIALCLWVLAATLRRAARLGREA